MPYREALDLQRLVHREVAGGVRPHTLLLLEHPPVYTLGRRGGREHLHLSPAEAEALGVEVLATDRGGLVTFHGPGQLVAYPIVGLAALGRSLAWYVARLLDAAVATARGLGVPAARVDPARPGIWVEERKLASVGVRLTEGATLHGLALNLDPDLSWFRRMSPCGLTVDATSLVAEGAPPVAPLAAGACLHRGLATALGLAPGLLYRVNNLNTRGFDLIRKAGSTGDQEGGA
ncbi:MAG: lipoyl(octanoyl) transferase LipB [Deltaproteobacteria bacterium]|nr:lipoyl(octanoyl) transferase LipB [Deltaproteobacteria bacterium]